MCAVIFLRSGKLSSNSSTKHRKSGSSATSRQTTTYVPIAAQPPPSYEEHIYKMKLESLEASGALNSYLGQPDQSAAGYDSSSEDGMYM